MKAINLFYYLVALGFPILLFTVLLDNYNETHPVQVFLLCIALSGLAGLLSSNSFPNTNKLAWVGWSIVIGIIEACLLAFAF